MIIKKEEESVVISKRICDRIRHPADRNLDSCRASLPPEIGKLTELANLKIDNNNFPIMSVNARKLRLRKGPSLNTAIIRLLNRPEKVRLLAVLPKLVSLEGKTSTWVWIETKDRTRGYCFAAYLKKVR